MRWRLLLVPLLVALAFGGWQLWQMRPPLVEAAAVVRGPAVEAVYATGTVEPVRWAAVAPAVKARLAEILVDDGDAVRAGDVLARLDDTVAQAQVAEVEARARFAEEDAQRLQQLLGRGAAAKTEVERAISEARALAAAAVAAQRRLDDYRLLAPMDGIVLRRDGEPGEMVDTNEPVFWIGEPLPLRITADVDEEDIPRVRVGQRVLLKADAFPSRVLEGTIDLITPKGDPVQKTYRVRIGLPPDTPLLIGMTVEGNIIVRETPAAVLVPTDAVREGAVYVIDGEGRAQRRTIEVGVRGPERTEVTAGLEPGEVVVVGPPAELRDGLRVRVRQDNPDLGAAASAGALGLG